MVLGNQTNKLLHDLKMVLSYTWGQTTSEWLIKTLVNNDMKHINAKKQKVGKLLELLRMILVVTIPGTIMMMIYAVMNVWSDKFKQTSEFADHEKQQLLN